MKFVFSIASMFFSFNLSAANVDFSKVLSCTPEDPAPYIVLFEQPQNLDFADGARIANALNTSGANQIVEVRNQLLTYFVIETTDLKSLKAILKPYLAKTNISIECDVAGGLD